MELSSPAFADFEDIPRRHSRDGDGANPPLQIAGVPRAAVSLVLIVDDMDSPIGAFTHWVVWNMPPETTDIQEGAIPPGAQSGLNGFGELGWSGPCPPSGRHRYRFRLLALDRELELGTPDRRDRVERAMVGHVLAEATLTGVYRAR